LIEAISKELDFRQSEYDKELQIDMSENLSRIPNSHPEEPLSLQILNLGIPFANHSFVEKRTSIYAGPRVAEAR